MAIDLSSEIYRLAKQFPPEETYALRNQIQRAINGYKKYLSTKKQ